MRKRKQSQVKTKRSKADQPPQRRQVQAGGHLYDVIYIDRKPRYLGRHGSKEAETEYATFVADWWAKKARTVAERNSPIPLSPKVAEAREVLDITVKELAAAFLEHAKATLAKPNYTHYRIAVMEFLVKLYANFIKAI